MLQGKRVLVVEDEPIVAMMVEDMLADLGVAVVGPATTLEEALSLARADRLDAAVLDVNLNGERSAPVAAVLQSRGVPFVFATGYGPGERDEHPTAPVVQKPYRGDQMAEALRRIMGG